MSWKQFCLWSLVFINRRIPIFAGMWHNFRAMVTFLASSGSSLLRTKYCIMFYCSNSELLLHNRFKYHEVKHLLNERENYSRIRMCWAFDESHYSNSFLMRSYIQVPLWRPESERMFSLYPTPRATAHTCCTPMYVSSLRSSFKSQLS